MQAQAEVALRATVLAQAQQRVQEQVGPPQDCHQHGHWHWLGSLLLVQYAQLAMLTVSRGRCPVILQRTTWSLLVTGASSLHMQSQQDGRAL